MVTITLTPELEQTVTEQVHVVAKPRDLPAELMGTYIFAMLKVSAQDAVPPENIATFCDRMNTLFAASLDTKT